MGDCAVLQSDSDHVLFGIFDAFTNRFRNFSCFAEACTDLTFAIADYDNSCKGKTTAAFNDFSNAVDENNVFL